jgi:hypothetical protein
MFTTASGGFVFLNSKILEKWSIDILKDKGIEFVMRYFGKRRGVFHASPWVMVFVN